MNSVNYSTQIQTIRQWMKTIDDAEEEVQRWFNLYRQERNENHRLRMALKKLHIANFATMNKHRTKENYYE